MSSHKTLAIVIRLIDFSESSYVATLFTESHGKITGLAKGGRRAKGPFENALDLLAISRVVFLSKSSGAMELLTEAKLERRFRAASRDVSRLYAGYYVAELLTSLTDERDPHPELFRSAIKTLVALDEKGDIGKAVLEFELAILRNMGQLPLLDRCVECGKPLSGEGRVSFGQLAGGVLCQRCRPGQRHVASLSRSAVYWLQRLTENLEQTDEDDEQMPEPSHDRCYLARVYGPRPVNPKEKAVRAELRGLMTHRMSHLLGRRPRMHAFLTGLR